MQGGGAAGLSYLVDCLNAELLVSQQLLFGYCPCNCSAQLLKQQLPEYTGCFALTGSPPP